MSSSEAEPASDHPWAMMNRRLKHPSRQLTFYVVLVLGVLILGYLAVWIEVVHALQFQPTREYPELDLSALRLAYATAILAVGGPCFMQLSLTRDKMAIVTGFILLFLFLFLAFCVSNASGGQGPTHLYGFAGLAVATLCWWLANGEDELFQDHSPPSAPSGGDPNRNLKGGNSGVKV